MKRVKLSGPSRAKFKFQRHSLTEAQRLWLTEAVKMPTYDARVLKIRLLGKIPVDFNPGSIDGRLWTEDRRLTLVGLWILEPENLIFSLIDIVVGVVKAEIY